MLKVITLHKMTGRTSTKRGIMRMKFDDNPRLTIQQTNIPNHSTAKLYEEDHDQRLYILRRLRVFK